MSLIVDGNGKGISSSEMNEIRKVVKTERSKEPIDTFGELNTKINNKIFKSYKELNPHSYVEEHELESNKKLIFDHLEFEPPRVVGFNMCVKIYVRSNEMHSFTDNTGKTIKFYQPDSVIAGDRFRSCVALVCAQGNECYTAPQFQGVRWCNVGDWIIIPRNEGIQINYRGVPMQLIQDINMYAVVEDPTYVTRD
jgi:hypothetical protein